jgi:hypothetical protein
MACEKKLHASKAISPSGLFRLEDAVRREVGTVDHGLSEYPGGYFLDLTVRPLALAQAEHHSPQLSRQVSGADVSMLIRQCQRLPLPFPSRFQSF